VYNLFDDKYISTIGVKVSRKTVVIPHNGDVVDLTMMIWDLAGSEEFTPVRASYLRGASGAVLVCDLTRPETLDNLSIYADDLRSVNPDARLTLAGNKWDLVESHLSGAEPLVEASQPIGGPKHLTPAHIESAAAELNATHFLTSAKTGDEVETLFRHLGHLLLT
jgi:GTPase SAR1 family protein